MRERKLDHGGAPGASADIILPVTDDVRMTIEDRMHDSPESACALAVDDSDLGDASFQAFFQVIRDQIIDVARRKRVQVERSINRNLDRIVVVHTSKSTD